jgi:hypothetical protein
MEPALDNGNGSDETTPELTDMYEVDPLEFVAVMRTDKLLP